MCEIIEYIMLLFIFLHKKLLSDRKKNVNINSNEQQVEKIIAKKITSNNNELTNLPKKNSNSNLYTLNT